MPDRFAMHIDLEKKRASLSVGEFSDFMPGPRDDKGTGSGIWRAQLGSRWHKELQKSADGGPDQANFEIQLKGEIFHQGWVLELNGRIDQLLTQPQRRLLREIKTVLRSLPAEESELRSEYPAYFVQAASYVAILKQSESGETQVLLPLAAELLFVEADSGLLQTVPLGIGDEALFRAQLDRVVAFLQQRWFSRERLRNMRFRSPFESFRPGQESALEALRSTLRTSHKAILLEAPTGFGKTGILLDAALGEMRAGHFERLIYLTSKSTGQLQVLETLQRICEIGVDADRDKTALNIWLVRPKSEHCINEVFRCLRETCPYLNEISSRWEQSGVQALFVHPESRREIADLREVGKASRICPYEITRAALPFSEVWIGDINYVFDPSVKGLFTEQPGFLPERTLLIVDEAHNLPARVADAYSHKFAYDDAAFLSSELRRLRAPQSLLRPLDEWQQLLKHLPEEKTLRLADEEDALQALDTLARAAALTPLDTINLDGHAAELLWEYQSFAEQQRDQPGLKRHWWSPRQSELSITCIDAADAIGEALRLFGGVLLSSATFGPKGAFASSIGMDSAHDAQEPDSLVTLSRKEQKAMAVTRAEVHEEQPSKKNSKLGVLNKRQTQKLFTRLTNAAELLRVEEERESSALASVFACAPWRDGAYDVAVDLRVDTRFQQRELHYGTTAATLLAWHHCSGIDGHPCAVFFPSYAYAESVSAEIARRDPGVRIGTQPRKAGLAEQNDWVKQALVTTDFLFLVLGSSFAEGIDMLGGIVRRAVVVGPALPEVNPIQQSRMELFSPLGRDEAFRRAYQIPGMQKVNQALGRLVRAPGQHARVLLHCSRFAEESYQNLLLPEYRQATRIADDRELLAWFE
jgi:Rad3-related DNA helicase